MLPHLDAEIKDAANKIVGGGEATKTRIKYAEFGVDHDEQKAKIKDIKAVKDAAKAMIKDKTYLALEAASEAADDAYITYLKKHYGPGIKTTEGEYKIIKALTKIQDEVGQTKGNYILANSPDLDPKDLLYVERALNYSRTPDNRPEGFKHMFDPVKKNEVSMARDTVSRS